MNVKLATVNLQSNDPQRAKRFHVDALGLAEDAARSSPPSFIYLRSGGCDVTISQVQQAGAADPSDSMELGFEVDDLESLKARLTSLGIYNYRQESMGWGDALELADPDGYRCVIYRLRASAMQLG